MNASRYTSLSAIAWISFLALVLKILPGKWWVTLVPLPLIVSVMLGGQGPIDAMEKTVPGQDLRAIALRLRLPIAATGRFAGQIPDIGSRLEAVGHYPFNGDFTADCGQLGRQVPIRDAAPEGFTGAVRARVDNPAFPTATSFAGDLQPGGRTVRCVVVLDDQDTVIGAGTLTAGPGDDSLVFATLAPQGSVQRVYVRVAGTDDFFPLQDPTSVTG